MKCILPCGGYATRLFPLTENFPKALLDIEEGKPILDYILDQVNTIEEVDHIYLISNNRYYDHFVEWANRYTDGKPITVLNDHTMDNSDRLGAIGDIAFTIDQAGLDDDLLIIAGDNLFDYPLQEVIDFYHQKNDETVVCASRLDDPEELKRFAVAKVDDHDQIVGLVEKPENPDGNTIIWATYLYPRKILPYIKKYLEEGNNPDSPGHLPEYLYTKLPVYAYHIHGTCYDIGTHASLTEVRDLYRHKTNEKAE